MSAWTTLQMAKKQVGIPLDDCDNDDWLRMKLAEAEAIVFNYLQGEPATITPIVQSAIYLQFAELWRFRGNDVDGDLPKGSIPGAPSVQVERCLYSLRAPSLG
jgi:hypothetical protein